MCRYMKSSILVLVISTLVLAAGCTRLPASEETGLGPGEYEGIVNTQEIKKENVSLKEELEKIKSELEDLEKEYLSLAKSNESIISKLQEAESKLDIVEAEDIPKFKIEDTDLNSIVQYLEESSSIIDKSVKGIDIISSGERVVFRTIGYGNVYSQIFIWDEGENEPTLIDGASFDKDGSYEWLDRYILIKSGGKNKVLDIENKKITGLFDEPLKMQLLKDTTTVLLKDKDNKFVLYDFINDSNKQINLDNNKYTDFNLQEDFVLFTGTYTENGVEYEIRARLALDELMEMYEIQRADEAGTASPDTEGTL
ncbi:MAG: hypothetical protein QM227_02195 [Bacillota bacterium]|jgi:hypothetical protein|nr:hypothetical protein [Bacillota bacterium]NLL59744.1 hypothetical protein [Tissierellia bacterium]